MRTRRIDIRQVLAAMLTLSMFAMLANMIKRDHFDYVEVKYPAGSTIQVQSLKITEKSSINHNHNNKEMRTPSRLAVEEMLQFQEEKKQMGKTCWNISSTFTNEKQQKNQGYISFSLTNGPEYHVSQVANAVVVAKYLGANLVIPDIRGTKHDATRNFSEIYDYWKFFDNLKGVVEVVHNGHDKTSSQESITTVQVPNMVSEPYIEAHIKPVFERTRNLRLTTFFPSINMKKGDGDGPVRYADPLTCLAMFGTLQFQTQVWEMLDNTVQRLRMSRQGSNVRFVSIDLRGGFFDRKSCEQNGDEEGKMNICGVGEIGEFLRGIGFGAETAVYVTRSRWHGDLDQLRKIFPRTYSRDLLMESDIMLKSSVDRVLDYYMCSESDVYVSTFSDDLFFTNVVGNRIVSGRRWVIDVSKIPTPFSASSYMSSSISRRTHWAYSCFCGDGVA